MSEKTPPWDEKCSAPPTATEIPTLRPGEQGEACDRTDYSVAGDTSAPSFDALELMKNVGPSVVKVEISRDDTTFIDEFLGFPERRAEVGTGTGFMVAKDGDDCLIATNAHVGDVADNSIRTADGTVYPATVEKSDYKHDLALLRVSQAVGTDSAASPLECKALPITKIELPEAEIKLDPEDLFDKHVSNFLAWLGLPVVPQKQLYSDKIKTNPDAKNQDIYVVGHPEGSNEQFISPGKTTGQNAAFSFNSANGYLAKDTKVFETTAHLEHGSSGSPAVNNEGEVVGVAFGVKNEASYVIPGEYLLDLVNPYLIPDAREKNLV